MNKIKFATPDIGRREIGRIGEAVESRWITSGPKVREFEKRIAQMSGCDRAVAYDSCTGAMEMALRALDIGPGDEVITTPYTYSATAEVIRNVGAKIVFVDLDERDNLSFEMDYDKVAAAITEKTKAVMPVDIGGKLCNYDALMAAVSSKQAIFKPASPLQEIIGRVAVVADAAHSFGADYGNRVCGQFADFTCFSFHVLKNITTGGEGGALVWRDFGGIDDALEERLRLLGDHGQTSRDKSRGWEYDIALFGYNSIMTDVDAAMGLSQLDRFEEIRQKRIDVTVRYDELFAQDDIVTPIIQHFGPTYTSAMHLYPVRLFDYNRVPAAFVGSIGDFRNDVYRKLMDAGIPCNVHYKPLPMMTAYKRAGFDIADYPRAYRMYSGLLTIPYHTELTADQQEYIVKNIWKAVSEV